MAAGGHLVRVGVIVMVTVRIWVRVWGWMRFWRKYQSHGWGRLVLGLGLECLRVADWPPGRVRFLTDLSRFRRGYTIR